MKSVFASCLILIVIIASPLFVFAQENIDVEIDLPYSYSFEKQYVVAGERILRITISNETDFHIEAIEVEIRLRNPFGEVVSDWSSFVNPDFEIPSQSSKSLSLKLTKRNILGATIENVLDQARYADIRYGRILLDDGTLLKQNDLYPALKGIYGNFKVEVVIPKEDDKYNLARVVRNTESIAARIGREFNIWDRSITTQEMIEYFAEQCIIIQANIKNISEHPIEKHWVNTHQPSVFQFVDEKGNQYSSFGYVLAPMQFKYIATGSTALQPSSRISLFYIFDKLKGYTPKWLEIYVEGKEYHKSIHYDF